MRANLRAHAVFQRRDDFAARGVVLRIRREDEHHVERQPHGIALNLDVALLHDVEQADLDFSGKIGQLVNREDATIGAGQKSVVHGEFVAEGAAGARGFDGIHVAENVRNGDVRRGQFLHVPIAARPPGNWSGVTLFRDQFAAGLADRAQRVIVDFAASEIRHFGIEKIYEAAQNAALRLSAQAEEDEIVPREKGIDDLRQDSLLVTVHALEKLAPRRTAS